MPNPNLKLQGQRKYGQPITFLDEENVSYGVKHTDNEPHVRAKITGSGTDDVHVISDGSLNQLAVSDSTSQTLLNSILKELKITNMHLSLMTDINIRKQEVE